ncbi:MAG: phosphoribosylanthranilate isomerase [Candidatus Hydrogenedentes bacterium]|nr:phosphoribosylanthranilate isomerase [Candidatus Hydrogenedentota bacterium]
MTRVKICGIVTPEDASAACEAGVDALGFNFAPEARQRGRFIEPDRARHIIEQLPPFVTTVAVCVNEPIERLREYLEFVDYVQLHGEESPDDYRAVAPRAIKAFRLGPAFDEAAMRAHPAAAYLLDAYTPGSRGGTGRTCDWDRAAQAARLGRPLILAGGLTPDNVTDAVRTVRPYAVDTAGGVETAPGKKDHDKIRQFVLNAKRALSVSG